MAVSSCWNFFDRLPDNTKARCKYCKSIFSAKGGNTTGLHRHISTCVKYKEYNSNPERLVSNAIVSMPLQENSTERVQTTLNLISFSMHEKIADMMAVDGFSAYQISNSKSIKEYFSLKQWNMPGRTKIVELFFYLL